MKKTCFALLLSSSLLTAHVATKLDNYSNNELSPNEKKVARICLEIDALFFATYAGCKAVSDLSEGAHDVVKGLAFTSMALGAFTFHDIVLKEINIMDYYKKHKKFFYFSVGATTFSCTVLTAAGLLIGLKKVSLL